MSSHFGRLSYDECYINEETKRSIKPGEYKLYNGQNDHVSSCHSENGPRNNRLGDSSETPINNLSERTEMESLLSNRDLPASKCSKGRTISDKRKSIARDLNKIVECDKFLNPNHFFPF